MITHDITYSSCKALHRENTTVACSGISQKPPLEDGTKEAPYDDGTQGLKSKSTMVSQGE